MSLFVYVFLSHYVVSFVIVGIKFPNGLILFLSVIGFWSRVVEEILRRHIDWIQDQILDKDVGLHLIISPAVLHFFFSLKDVI